MPNIRPGARDARALLALAALLLSARATGAQSRPSSPEASAVAPRDAEPAGQFVFAAGLDHTIADGPASGPGVSLHGGYERRLGTSRWGLRLAGDWVRGSARYGVPAALGGAGDEVHRITTIVGGGAYATFALTRAPVRSFLRPYALAGLGLQQLSLRHEGNRRFEGFNGWSQTIYAAPVRRNVASYTAGLGLTARLGPGALFVEGRLTALPAGGARLDRPGVATLLAPLTFGVRF